MKAVLARIKVCIWKANHGKRVDAGGTHDERSSSYLLVIESKCGREEDIDLSAHGKCEDTEDQKRNYGYVDEDEEEVLYMSNDGHEEVRVSLPPSSSLSEYWIWR